MFSYHHPQVGSHLTWSFSVLWTIFCQHLLYQILKKYYKHTLEIFDGLVIDYSDKCEFCNKVSHINFLVLSAYKSYVRRRRWHPTPVLLPRKSHGWRSLVGCSPWGREESDTTERLHFHFSLSCIGEGNSNPLQCSCLENPRDGGAWLAAVYGVAQSRTRLKRLSSSSSSSKSYVYTVLYSIKCATILHLKMYIPLLKILHCFKALNTEFSASDISCNYNIKKWSLITDSHKK